MLACHCRCLFCDDTDYAYTYYGYYDDRHDRDAADADITGTYYCYCQHWH